MAKVEGEAGSKRQEVSQVMEGSAGTDSAAIHEHRPNCTDPAGHPHQCRDICHVQLGFAEGLGSPGLPPILSPAISHNTGPPGKPFSPPRCALSCTAPEVSCLLLTCPRQGPMLGNRFVLSSLVCAGLGIKPRLCMLGKRSAS